MNGRSGRRAPWGVLRRPEPRPGFRLCSAGVPSLRQDGHLSARLRAVGEIARADLHSYDVLHAYGPDGACDLDAKDPNASAPRPLSLSVSSVAPRVGVFSLPLRLVRWAR